MTHARRSGLARARAGIRALALSALACAAATPDAAAQVDPALAEGARVRIRPLDSRARYVGTIARLARDSLFLDLDGPGPLARTFTLDGIDRIELSAGRRPVTVQAAFFGAVAAGLVSMTYNHLDTFSCATICDDEPDLNTAAVTAMGALAGGILGWLFPRERWLAISLPAGPSPR